MVSLADLHRLVRPVGPGERLLQRILWPLRNAWMALRRLGRKLGIRLRHRPAPRPLRLHVGCGTHRLEGWVNLDIEPLEGVDEVLKEHGLRYFITDTHGILHASPRPKYGVYAPVYCPSGA